MTDTQHYAAGLIEAARLVLHEFGTSTEGLRRLDSALAATHKPVALTAKQMRPNFEWWWTTRGSFPPIGSTECRFAWYAWVASGGYTAPSDWKVTPMSEWAIEGINTKPPSAPVEAQAVPVGEAAMMPGSDGFTMACFNASDVPVGTKLFVAPQSAPVEAQAVPEGWRPISEAPQGVRVLLGPRHAPVVGIVRHSADWEEDREPSCTVLHYNNTTFVRRYHCSEWHALPAAPTPSTKGGA